jgi:hypothetical protein
LDHRAESVAEFTKRPLYAVSSGELGTYSSELEKNLARILDVATVWKAVLLLDEADVFLERAPCTTSTATHLCPPSSDYSRLARSPARLSHARTY